jgi:RNA recognition motif-containing protein
MTKDLYVRNISSQATEEDVRKLFAVAGKVSYIHLIVDDKSGAMTGRGYVKMASEAAAKEALNILDGALLIDRVIEVREARPQKPGPKPSRGPERKGGPRR